MLYILNYCLAVSHSVKFFFPKLFHFLSFFFFQVTVKFQWAYLCSEDLLARLIFRGAYFRKGLLSEGVLHFKTSWT